MSVSDEFWACEKFVQNRQNDGALAPKAKSGINLGGSAGEAVVLGRGSRAVLLVLGTSFGRTFDTPSSTV